MVSTCVKRRIRDVKNKHITQHQEDESANPKLNEENVHVYYEDRLWKVKSTDAKQASDTFDTKSEAVNRAQHIAENKGTKVIEHRKDE